MKRALCIPAILLVLASLRALALEPPAATPPPVEHPAVLPEGDAGIAADYPGDARIAEDPAVLFAEDFEERDLPAVLARWTNVRNKDGEVLSLSSEVPPSSLGKSSLEMTATRGKNDGGHVWKLISPGVDIMFARFYVRFSDDHPYVHHFVKVGAWRDSPVWPQGEAGYRHDGTKSFQTGIEPLSGWGRYPPPGAWAFYTYWCGMKSYLGPDAKIFYGNTFAPREPSLVPRGRWQCVEVMLKANTAPERHDGEEAFWIDGRLVARFAPGIPKGRWVKDVFVADDNGAPFEGFQWRLRDDLKINTFWLLYYMDAVFKGNKQFEVPRGVEYNPNVGRVWFDDVVVAAKYIGPITAAPKGSP
jgi:hypothetical protein